MFDLPATLRLRGGRVFDPPEADKCLLACGELDVHLLKGLLTTRQKFDTNTRIVRFTVL
jgi:hypothetical protein